MKRIRKEGRLNDPDVIARFGFIFYGASPLLAPWALAVCPKRACTLHSRWSWSWITGADTRLTQYTSPVHFSRRARSGYEDHTAWWEAVIMVRKVRAPLSVSAHGQVMF